jgi:predicted PurR-regulated permease PerM
MARGHEDGSPRRESLRTAGFTVVGLVVVTVLWALRDVLMLVAFSALLAFALEPAVVWLTSLRFPRGGISRPFASALVMFVLAGLGAWAIVRVVPQVFTEFAALVQHAPENIARVLGWAREQAIARGWPYLADLRGPDIAALARTAGGVVLAAVTGVLGNLGAILGLVLMPILSFYLLTERDAVEHGALGFVPEDLRPRARQALRAIDRALRSYVRGQAFVCATMGVAGWLTFWALGLPASLLLGVVVGLAEVMPVIGFWIASIAIVLAGWSVSPAISGWAFVAYLVLNQLLSLFVTPRIMGRHMRMHPFIVTVSILSGGALLGPAGAILALPIAASLYGVISEFAPRPDEDGGTRGTRRR